MIINLIFLIANLIMAAMFISMLYFMVKARRDGINIVLVSSILLMKIGKEYLGMILFALFVINDIILIIKNYLNKWRND